MATKRTPRYGETRPTAALAIKHVRRLVRVGHCQEAEQFLRNNPQIKVRRGTLLNLQKVVWACKPWIPPSLRR